MDNVRGKTHGHLQLVAGGTTTTISISFQYIEYCLDRKTRALRFFLPPVYVLF